jgi:hypothetical protein
MDAFESGVFYPTKTTSDVEDTLYMNAAGGKKAEGNYESQYRARYTPKNTVAGMKTTIQALQAELERVNNKRCPKETLGKVVLTGGIANIPARKCRREKEARANAISNVINEYQDRVAGMIADADAKKKEAEQAAMEAAQQQVSTDMNAPQEPTSAGMLPSGGMNTKTLLLIGGLAVAGIIVTVMMRHK